MKLITFVSMFKLNYLLPIIGIIITSCSSNKFTERGQNPGTLSPIAFNQDHHSTKRMKLDAVDLNHHEIYSRSLTPHLGYQNKGSLTLTDLNKNQFMVSKKTVKAISMNEKKEVFHYSLLLKKPIEKKKNQIKHQWQELKNISGSFFPNSNSSLNKWLLFLLGILLLVFNIFLILVMVDFARYVGITGLFMLIGLFIADIYIFYYAYITQ